MVMGSSTNIYTLQLLLLIITTQLRDGIADSQEKWYEDKNGRFKWSFGCSFTKDYLLEADINKIKEKESSSCPSLCYENKRCTHAIYTKGNCYLKSLKFVDASPKAAIYNNPGGLCSFVVERPDVVKSWVVGHKGRTRWANDCTYPNAFANILSGTKFMFDSSKCADHCLSIKRCTHFEWILNVCFVKYFGAIPVVQTLLKTAHHVCGFIPERQNAVKKLTKNNKNINDHSLYNENMIKTTTPNSNQQPKVSNTSAQPKTDAKNANMKDKARLLFNDDFSIDFNSNKNWKRVTGVTPVGFQYFTDSNENSYVENGILFIKPTLTVDRYGENFLRNGYLDLIEEGCDPRAADKRCIISAKLSKDIIHPVASATITTNKSFNFTFGTVEIRAKMPKGDWISTGISLLPLNKVYGQWPLSGEIEFLRVNSNRRMICSNKIAASGRQRATSAIRWGPSIGAEVFSFVTNSTLNHQSQDVDFSSDFHIFRMDWTPHGFKFLVDGQRADDGQLNVPKDGLWKLVLGDEGKHKDHPWITGSKMAPFDQPFYLSVSVSVGGSSLFPDSCEYGRPSGKPWSSSDMKPMQKFWDDIEHWLPTWKANENKNALQIDYIRVYSR